MKTLEQYEYTLATFHNVFQTNYGVKGGKHGKVTTYTYLPPYVLVVSFCKPTGTLVLRLHMIQGKNTTK